MSGYDFATTPNVFFGPASGRDREDSDRFRSQTATRSLSATPGRTLSASRSSARDVYTPPTASLFDGSLAAIVPPAATTVGSLLPAENQAVVADSWVTVFGIQPEDLETVLQEFQKCGNIIDRRGPSHGNWALLKFETKSAAVRALARSGEYLRPDLIVGVRELDQEQRLSVQSSSAAQQNEDLWKAPNITPGRPRRVQHIRDEVAVPQPSPGIMGVLCEALWGS